MDFVKFPFFDFRKPLPLIALSSGLALVSGAGYFFLEPPGRTGNQAEFSPDAVSKTSTSVWISPVPRPERAGTQNTAKARPAVTRQAFAANPPAANVAASSARQAVSSSAIPFPISGAATVVSTAAPRPAQQAAIRNSQNFPGSGFVNPAPAEGKSTASFVSNASGLSPAVSSAPIGGSGGRSAVSGGNAQADGSILLPAALAPQSPEIPITTQTQVSEWESLQDDFVEEVGGTTPNLQDPAKREQWMSAQEYNDWMFKAKFGMTAFLLQNAEAGRQGGNF